VASALLFGFLIAQTLAGLPDDVEDPEALARLVAAAAVPLWVLDEPFTALDQGAISRLQEMIGAHVRRGGIVIFTSHQDVAIAGAVCRTVELGT